MAHEALFAQIREEIPGFAAAAVGSFDGAFATAGESGHDLNPVRDALVALAKAWDLAYDELGGPVDFGSNDEVLVSASKGFLLIRVAHGSGKFVAVQLEASGNIGYLRFRMREYLRRAVAA